LGDNLGEDNQIQFGENMKIINRFKALSFFVIAASLLSACGGALQQSTISEKAQKTEANPVAFSGVVETMSGSQWTVGGQPLTLDPQASLDPNIAVGDTVNVEGKVSADGAVVAMKVESSAKDEAISTPSADASTPEPIKTPEVNGISDPASPQAVSGSQNEVIGTVEALTADTITIDGVTYNLANSTEIKDSLAVGDQVKVHVIANADGTFTVREIEKTTATTVDDHSSNSNGMDDGANHDINDDNSSSSNGLDNGANHDISDDNSSNSGNGTDDGATHDSNDDSGGSEGSSGPGGG
jgi:uncharacterized protein DUF5666